MKLGEVEDYLHHRRPHHFVDTFHSEFRKTERPGEMLVQAILTSEMKGIINQEGPYRLTFKHDGDKDINIVVRMLYNGNVRIVTFFASETKRRIRLQGL